MSSEIVNIIETKFDEFKKSLLSDLQMEINKVVKAGKEEILEFFEKKKGEFSQVASHHVELKNSLEAIQQHVKTLQDENKRMRESNDVLRMEVDDLQQYVRRPNLRIYGVPVEKNETSGMVERKVKGLLDDVLVDGVTIDRAHRIGKVTEKNGVKSQPIIVRFPTFRERTLAYKIRKTIKDRHKYGVSLDLTKSRLNILNTARDMVKDVRGIQFAYSDINCHLRVFTDEGKHVMFKSISDLENIIANL